jgi:hypothetical protein
MGIDAMGNKLIIGNTYGVTITNKCYTTTYVGTLHKLNTFKPTIILTYISRVLTTSGEKGNLLGLQVGSKYSTEGCKLIPIGAPIGKRPTMLKRPLKGDYYWYKQGIVDGEEILYNPCSDCGNPVKVGYICNFCGNDKG